MGVTVRNHRMPGRDGGWSYPRGLRANPPIGSESMITFTRSEHHLTDTPPTGTGESYPWVMDQHPEEVARTTDHLAPELIAFRRDLHAHPELSRAEFRTTEAI